MDPLVSGNVFENAKAVPRTGNDEKIINVSITKINKRIGINIVYIRKLFNVRFFSGWQESDILSIGKPSFPFHN